MPGLERKSEMPKKEVYDVTEKIDPMEFLMLKKENFELKEKIKALEKLVTKDALTGLDNRRSFNQALAEAIEEQKKIAVAGEHREIKNKGNALVLMDIDNFKKINDQHGHLKGDEVLVEIGGLLQKSVRHEDLAARYGGEELALILNDVDEEEALKIADKLRQKINRELEFSGKGNGKFNVSVSVGVSSLGKEDTPETLIDRADHALYNSKDNGRNRVSINRNGEIEEYNDDLTEGKGLLDSG